MSFRINTNISAMTANMHLNIQNLNTDRSLSALSSGSALESSAYNASGLTIANGLSAQVSGYGQAIMNSNDSIGMIQVADGALQGYGDTLDRVRTLTLKASNGIMNDSNRAIIQNEIDSLMESANNIATNTTYNGINLLDGSAGANSDGRFITHSGANADDTLSVMIGDARTSSILNTPIDVMSEEGRASSLDSIDSAIKTIGAMRSELGAGQNQLRSNIENISLTRINLASAESQIRDVDFAAESANFSKANMMSQIGSFTQAQSNSIQLATVSNLLS